jgi:hypothetical protein
MAFGGFFYSAILIAGLVAFNIFAVDTVIKMRSDVQAVRRMVYALFKSQISSDKLADSNDKLADSNDKLADSSDKLADADPEPTADETKQ